MNEPVTGITASTKRNPAPVGGKVSAPVVHLASLTLTFAPLPLSPEVAEQYKLQSPRKAFETGVMALVDVIEGDILTTGGVNYQVRAAEKYPPVAYTKIIIEKVMA